MEENWYAVEQQIRDRLNEARAAARTRTLIQKRAPTARRPNSVGITIIRLANRILACAGRLPLELSRVLASARAATKRRDSAGSERTPPRTPRSPNSGPAVDAKQML
jgi:hypothetical protein